MEPSSFAALGNRYGTMPSLSEKVPAGRHTAFALLPDSERTASIVEGDIPEIQNTKCASRWYARGPLTITDSYEVPQVERYDPAPLLSLRVFCTYSGTILANPLLWIEQAVVLGIFIAVTVTLVTHPTLAHDMMPTVWKAFNEKDADIRSFCSMMATMATFLLGFFTSVNVARWWRLRTDGIGNTWSATSQLCMFLSQYVTNDEQILCAIRRYSRASLMLVFMRQRGYVDQLGILEKRGVLTAEEVGQLKQWNNNLAESIWAWNSHIVFMLYDQGLVRSEHQLVFLMERVNQGRAGIATICAQLGTPIPMQYVHFIGLMVKIHNIGMALLMGTIMAGNIFMGREVMCITITLRVFFLPILYNSILLINEEIMNPFSGDLMDYPMRKFDENIESDGKSYIAASNYLPQWMEAWKVSVGHESTSSLAAKV